MPTFFTGNNSNTLTYHSVTVTNIELFGDQEGTIDFTVGDCNISAFFYGETFTVGEKFEAIISQLDYGLEWDIIFSENAEKQKRLDPSPGLCSYYGYGCIESINPVIANFGCVRLHLGDWTNDERVVGEYIYWKVERLDISRMNPKP